MTTDAEIEEKAAFAAFLLRESDPFKAALLLHPNNTNRALWIANHWKNDVIVLSHMGEMREAGVTKYNKELLREQLTEKMLAIVDDTGEETKERINAAQFIANLHALIQKPETIINSNTLIMPKAIEVFNHGSDDDWEAAAEKQQRELLSVSRSRH